MRHLARTAFCIRIATRGERHVQRGAFARRVARKVFPRQAKMMQVKVALVVKGGQILHPSIKRSDFPCQLLMLLPGKIVLKGGKILLLIGSVVFIIRHMIVSS